ncbi:hypothetical protein MTO96_000694 [Rhipicephalus appendiculatus]
MLYSSLKQGWDAVLTFRVVLRPGEPADEVVVSQGRSFDTLQEWYTQEKETTVQRAHFEFIRSQFGAGGDGTTTDNAVTYSQMWDIAAPAMDALLPFFGSSRAAPKPADWFANSSSVGLTEARWIETLRRVNVSVADSLHILSDDRAFLEMLLALWENYGEDQFHLFVSWCTVEVAALYANRGLILNHYGQVPDRAMLYYKAFCVSKALFFSPSLIAKYSSNEFHSKAGAVAKEMVLSIRLAFARRLSKWPYYNPNVTVIANWNSLDSAFRDFEYDDETGHTASNGVPDMTDSFMANWQHSVLLNSTRQVTELSNAVRHLWLRSTSWGEHDFHLMPYTLSFPFFDSKLPTSVNFGGFGAEVADALGAILVGSYQAYSNVTDSLFKCLMRGPSGEEEYAKEYVSSAIGYSAVVDAFRQVPHTAWVLEGLEKFSDMQLLFISGNVNSDHLCNLLCSVAFPALRTIGRLRDFIADSGVPGCDVLCGKRGGGFRKAVWAIVLATLLSLTLQECIQVFLEYGRFPVSFDYSYEEEDSLHFPAVTVCNVNPLKKTALCKSKLSSSQDMPEQLRRRLCENDTIFYQPNPDDAATQMQLTAWMAQLSSSRYHRLETLTTQFEDMIVSCSYGRRNCTNRNPIFMNRYGNCLCFHCNASKEEDDFYTYDSTSTPENGEPSPTDHVVFAL